MLFMLRSIFGPICRAIIDVQNYVKLKGEKI